MSVRALEQTAAIRLLLLLAKHGKMSMLDIRYHLDASNTAIYNAIKKLSKAGLVNDEYEEHFPRRRLISLTEKGRRVAELLAQIEAVLEGSDR